MKSWKTTLAGILAGSGVAITAVINAFEAGAFTSKTGEQLGIAIAIVALGAFAKDGNVTGGTVQQ
jgi:hypothetical protein